MSILIVESSKTVREKLIRFLELEKLFNDVYEAGTVAEAKMIMKQLRLDIVLFDIQLEGNSGLELISFSRKLLHKPVLILCTNYNYPQYRSIYEYMSVYYLFDKTSEMGQLKIFIKKLVGEAKIILDTDSN